MDAAASAHLHQLARDHRPTRAGVEQVSDGIVSLVDQLGLPAFVAGRRLDCLASNQLARKLSPNFTPGRNLLRALFLDPAERQLHLDWDDAAAGVVGGLRQAAAGETSDTRLDGLIDELCACSAPFADLWAKADVGYRPAGTSHLQHPEIGELLFRRNRFAIPDSDGQILQIYHPEPGTITSEKLALLKQLLAKTNEMP
jgi:hypothetical protein